MKLYKAVILSEWDNKFYQSAKIIIYLKVKNLFSLTEKKEKKIIKNCILEGAVTVVDVSFWNFHRASYKNQKQKCDDISKLDASWQFEILPLCLPFNIQLLGDP